MVKGTPELTSFVKAHRNGHDVADREIYAVIIGVHRTLVQVWAQDVSAKRVAAFNAHNVVEVTDDGRVRIQVRTLLPGPDEWAEFLPIEYRFGIYRDLRSNRLHGLAESASEAIGPTPVGGRRV